MKDFSLELPTITLEKSHIIRDPAHDLHIEFHGRAHTAGDVVVYCSQKRILATGDLVNGSMPYMPDSYPKSWVNALDSVNKLPYRQVLSGHGPIMSRGRVMNYRSFLEELNTRVEQGKRAGKTVDEVKKSITVRSLKSLQADGYLKYVSEIRDSLFPHWDRKFIGPAEAFQDALDGTTATCYRRIDLG